MISYYSYRKNNDFLLFLSCKNKLEILYIFQLPSIIFKKMLVTLKQTIIWLNSQSQNSYFGKLAIWYTSYFGTSCFGILAILEQAVLGY